jgi:hypothetical protein
MTRYLLLFDSYGLALLGRPLWLENGSVFCVCCWPSPAQSFSGPSPLGLATIFYCLRFETSLFVATYDSQGYSGGMRPPNWHGRPSYLPYNFSARTEQKTLFPTVPLLLRVDLLLWERVYRTIARKRPWCIRPPRGRCIETALRAAVSRICMPYYTAAHPRELYVHWKHKGEAGLRNLSPNLMN